MWFGSKWFASDWWASLWWGEATEAVAIVPGSVEVGYPGPYAVRINLGSDMISHNFDIEVSKRSTRPITFDLYTEDAATACAVAEDDQVRFKVWSDDDESPLLELCDVATDNGSYAKITTDGTAGTTPAVVTVNVGQDDTVSLTSGKRYKAELGLIDNSADSPADAYTVVATGYVRLLGSATGERGLATES